MKMKMPDLSGTVIVMKSDQEEAQKCYENSLKTKRGVFMVFERPPSSDIAMEVEPLNEATPTESTPIKAAHVGATPSADARMEAGHDDASPVEEASPREHCKATPTKEDSRDQPAANVVERQIGGKTFKLGCLLSQEEQDESGRGDFTPLRCFCVVRLRHVGHRPRLSMPPSQHVRHGSPRAAEEEKI